MGFGLRVGAVACCLVASLTLAGCGGRPEGVLAALAQRAPGTSRVDMLVATTRRGVDDPGRMFSGERDRALNYADITISIPPDAVRQVGEVQWPSGRGDPAREFVALKADRLDEKAALRAFHDRLRRTSHRRALVFVHGFNTRFGEAVFRLAQIAHDSNVAAAPVLFTWPSRGQLLAYTYDRESANYSRDALERVLQNLVDDPAVGEIDVLAHSMGNWVALEALRQMAIRKGAIPAKVKNVMLASPDVDVDVFRRQIIEMGATRPPFTLFVAQDDNALAASQRIWGGVRVGSVDPNSAPYKALFAAQNINVVDLTEIRTSDRLGHTKFAESPEVVRLIGARLAGGQTLNDGKAGLGDKLARVTTDVAATVGATAGLALSAPLAVIDGRTRDNLEGQLQGLGDKVEDAANAAARVPADAY